MSTLFNGSKRNGWVSLSVSWSMVFEKRQAGTYCFQDSGTTSTKLNAATAHSPDATALVCMDHYSTTVCFRDAVAVAAVDKSSAHCCGAWEEASVLDMKMQRCLISSERSVYAAHTAFLAAQFQYRFLVKPSHDDLDRRKEMVAHSSRGWRMRWGDFDCCREECTGTDPSRMPASCRI